MATFDQNVTIIKQAQYGYEVRDAMAEGLTQCYEKASSIVCLTYTETELSSGGKMKQFEFLRKVLHQGTVALTFLSGWVILRQVIMRLLQIILHILSQKTKTMDPFL